MASKNVNTSSDLPGAMWHSRQWRQLFLLDGLFQATPHHTSSTTAAFGAELSLISIWCKQASSQRGGLIWREQARTPDEGSHILLPAQKSNGFDHLTLPLWHCLNSIHKLQLITLMLHHPKYLPWGLRSPQGRNPLPLYSAAGSDLGRSPQLLWCKPSLKLKTHTGGNSLSTGDRQHYNGTAERG